MKSTSPPTSKEDKFLPGEVIRSFRNFWLVAAPVPPQLFFKENHVKI
jgi:hypothetical protein